jgi:hypothetical protein
MLFIIIFHRCRYGNHQKQKGILRGLKIIKMTEDGKKSMELKSAFKIALKLLVDFYPTALQYI